MSRKIKSEDFFMKTLLLIGVLVVGCSSRPEEPREEQQEVQTLEQEERARTGYSDELGPGYDHGTTSSQKN